MKPVIWHNPACSTSRNALALLRERDLDPEIVLYLETPPRESDIRAVLREAGLSARDLLRTRAAPYDELGLENSKFSEAELIAAMMRHPVLIERPVVRTAKGTRLCRPLNRIEEIL